MLGWQCLWPEILQCGRTSHASLGSPRTLIFHHQRRAATMAMLTMLHGIWPGSGFRFATAAASSMRKGAGFPFRCHVQFINIILSIFTAVQQGHSPPCTLAPQLNSTVYHIAICCLFAEGYADLPAPLAPFPHAPFASPFLLSFFICIDTKVFFSLSLSA